MATDSKYSSLRCPVCQHGMISGLDSLCSSHKVALENIRLRYNDWVKGYGSLTKEDYLRLLTENSEAGNWVVEVAAYLIRERLTERL